MTPAAGMTAAYGVFSLAGGIIGYVKAKSRASLIAGSISGVLLMMSACGIQSGSLMASAGGAVIALLLGARFLGTWLKTRRLMPDLLMIGFSLATLILLGMQLLGGP